MIKTKKKKITRKKTTRKKAPTRRYKKDPDARLEARRYDNSIASRKLILSEITHEGALTFDIVTVEEEGKRRRTVNFNLFPLYGRLYFLVDVARIIRVRPVEITKVIHVHDLESGEDGEISLSDFVAHVKKGVWLLQDKADKGDSPQGGQVQGEGPRAK